MNRAEIDRYRAREAGTKFQSNKAKKKGLSVSAKYGEGYRSIEGGNTEFPSEMDVNGSRNQLSNRMRVTGMDREEKKDKEGEGK